MLEGACHCRATSWTFDGMPESVTSCNCTLCRKLGTLWIYDYENERIRVAGPTSSYVRRDVAQPGLEILFCATCANVVAWRGLALEDGKRRIAVNLRLVGDPRVVAHLPIDHFEGLESFTDLPRDARCVEHMWF